MPNNTIEDSTIKVEFETINQFRILAPKSVAQGMLALVEDDEDFDELDRVKADMMDLIAEHVPMRTIETGSANGKRITQVPAYSARFSEQMIRDIDARYKELSVSRAHQRRMANAKEYLLNFKPTISLAEALFRLSFYLIPNKNNLAKSTNNLINFTKRIFEDAQNNILVDSAILLGGQGKSTVQTGLKNAIKTIGLSASSCLLPSVTDGVSEVFVKNELCVDEDSKWERINYEILNKIADKQQITIKGKYIKEWNARSIANIFVGTNFLPTDVNDRRYSIRMVDETFKLEDNFGKWTIPGEVGSLSTSYALVVDWTTEAWLNLFYYCNKYALKPLEYKEQSFDYNLLYRIKRALSTKDTNVATISEMVSYFEQSDGGEIYNSSTKYTLRNKLFMLAHQLKLAVVGEPKKNMYNTYDWTDALNIDDKSPENPLEFVHCFFYNNPDFQLNS